MQHSGSRRRPSLLPSPLRPIAPFKAAMQGGYRPVQTNSNQHPCRPLMPPSPHAVAVQVRKSNAAPSHLTHGHACQVQRRPHGRRRRAVWQRCSMPRSSASCKHGARGCDRKPKHLKRADLAVAALKSSPSCLAVAAAWQKPPPALASGPRRRRPPPPWPAAAAQTNLARVPPRPPAGVAVEAAAAPPPLAAAAAWGTAASRSWQPLAVWQVPQVPPFLPPKPQAKHAAVHLPALRCRLALWMAETAPAPQAAGAAAGAAGAPACDVAWRPAGAVRCRRRPQAWLAAAPVQQSLLPRHRCWLLTAAARGPASWRQRQGRHGRRAALLLPAAEAGAAAAGAAASAAVPPPLHPRRHRCWLPPAGASAGGHYAPDHKCDCGRGCTATPRP